MPPKSWFDRFEKKKVMSEADKLFLELGYYHKKRNKEDERFHIEYISDDGLIIQFWYDKTISKIDDVHDASYITMQELKAINKKCEEMGWTNE